MEGGSEGHKFQLHVVVFIIRKLIFCKVHKDDKFATTIEMEGGSGSWK